MSRRDQRPINLFNPAGVNYIKCLYPLCCEMILMQDVTYNSCTMDDSHQRWCAGESDIHADPDKKWGVCAGWYSHHILHLQIYATQKLIICIKNI